MSSYSPTVKRYKFCGVLVVDRREHLCVRNEAGSLLSLEGRRGMNHNLAYSSLKRSCEGSWTPIKVEVLLNSTRDQFEMLENNDYVQIPYQVESLTLL